MECWRARHFGYVCTHSARVPRLPIKRLWRTRQANSQFSTTHEVLFFFGPVSLTLCEYDDPRVNQNIKAHALVNRRRELFDPSTHALFRLSDSVKKIISETCQMVCRRPIDYMQPALGWIPLKVQSLSG